MPKTTLFPLLLALTLAACGKNEAPATPQTQAPASAQKPTSAEVSMAFGQHIYQHVCAACHGQGVAGAPKIGDKSQWAPRIAQGKDTLYKHAIEGFTGKGGTMPPRGGNPKLPDDAVKEAVDYLIAQSGG